MPKIYSDQQKAQLKVKLLSVGFELIVKQGLKAANIKTITTQVGIAPGTFYHFFASKEALVRQLAIDYQAKINSLVNQWIIDHGGLTRTDVAQLYRMMFLEDQGSIFRYLKRDDVELLVHNQSMAYQQHKPIMEAMLSKLINPKTDINIPMVYNWIQLLNICVENRDLLAEEAFTDTFEAILQQLLEAIFASQEPIDEL
jgi:AcrR family transcriptional regulator